MKNKLYFVFEKEENMGQMVSAPNWIEARKIGRSITDIEIIDQLGVSVVKGGHQIWDGETYASNEYEVIGGIVYVDYPTGVVDWDTVIEDFKKRNLIKLNKSKEEFLNE